MGAVSGCLEHGLPGEDGLGWQGRQGRAPKPSGATLRLCPLPSEKQEVDEDSHKEMTHSESHLTKIKLLWRRNGLAGQDQLAVERPQGRLWQQFS